MITSDKPPAIVEKSTAPTTAEKAALALLSFVDFEQTQKYLARTSPTGRWAGTAPYEADPILGRHPSTARLALTGVALDELVLHIRNPTIRHVTIGLELGNCLRNVVVVKMDL